MIYACNTVRTTTAQTTATKAHLNPFIQLCLCLTFPLSNIFICCEFSLCKLFLFFLYVCVCVCGLIPF